MDSSHQDQDIASYLSRSELFAKLDTQRLESLIKHGEICQTSEGEVLFHEGETGDILYLILEGKVRVTTEADPDKVFILKDGDIMGEIGVLDGLPRTATVTAETGMTLFRLSREQLSEFLNTEPSMALTLMQVSNRKIRAALGREKELNASLKEANAELERLNGTLETLVHQKTEQLRRAVDDLKEMVERDPLTGIYNRRKFDELLEQGLETAENLALIMLDVDHFKKLNDTHGHQAGDRVLIQVAEVSQDCLQEGQYLARYGGEEFGIILEGADPNQARAVAERVRASIESFHFPVRDIARGEVCASLGVSHFPSQAKDVESLIKAADHALYQAKEEGRNRVVAFAG